MQPWKLVADPTGYIFTLARRLLGAARRRRRRADRRLLRDPPHAARPRRPLREGRPLLVHRRLQPAGARSRWSLGIAPCVPGFLGDRLDSWTASLPPIWIELYHYAWFVSFGISFVSNT